MGRRGPYPASSGISSRNRGLEPAARERRASAARCWESSELAAVSRSAPHILDNKLHATCSPSPHARATGTVTIDIAERHVRLCRAGSSVKPARCARLWVRARCLPNHERHREIRRQIADTLGGDVSGVAASDRGPVTACAVAGPSRGRRRSRGSSFQASYATAASVQCSPRATESASAKCRLDGMRSSLIHGAITRV